MSILIVSGHSIILAWCLVNFHILTLVDIFKISWLEHCASNVKVTCQNMYRAFLHFLEKTFGQWKVTISSKKKRRKKKKPFLYMAWALLVSQY